MEHMFWAFANVSEINHRREAGFERADAADAADAKVYVH